MTTMNTMTATKYTVRRFFNGDYVSDASTHRTEEAASKAAAKLLRGMSAGWDARVYLGDKRVD